MRITSRNGKAAPHGPLWGLVERIRGSRPGSALMMIGRGGATNTMYCPSAGYGCGTNGCVPGTRDKRSKGKEVPKDSGGGHLTRTVMGVPRIALNRLTPNIRITFAERQECER